MHYRIIPDIITQIMFVFLRCNPGWQGATCEQCIPFPGCVHGTCKKAWQCMCEQGWVGSQCNQGESLLLIISLWTSRLDLAIMHSMALAKQDNWCQAVTKECMQ